MMLMSIFMDAFNNHEMIQRRTQLIEYAFDDTE